MLTATFSEYYVSCWVPSSHIAIQKGINMNPQKTILFAMWLVATCYDQLQTENSAWYNAKYNEFVDTVYPKLIEEKG
jgi:hypothetical protein